MWDRDYIQNKDKYIELFDKCMRDTNNCIVDELEQRFCDYTKRKYAIAVNSATDALHFSLLSYGIGSGDDVLVSDFSWISSASCISMVGARPIFCDIDINSYHITLEQIKYKLTVNTKAIVYTHLFGNMSDTTDIIQFCKDNDIIFIEDAAQSLGSSYNNTKAGSIGDISSYSFNDNKVVSGISGGGIVLTDDYHKATYVRKLRRHGKYNSDFSILGYNSTMYNMNAAFINYRLDMLDTWLERRQEIAEEYDDVLQDADVYIQTPQDNQVHNYHKYTVRLKDKLTRDTISNQLKLSVHYDKPISENKQYDLVGEPNAKLVSDTILTLPNHPYMTSQEIERIAIAMSGI